ncbi:MAG TPA: patatin-like phospholipase family protein [Rhizomicrobium sp.]|nr:patatin-like phospholipase family protein [Rhizomicrobium sp.]
MHAKLLPGEKMVLVLQGGGALGAYQAGAYEALAEAGLAPNDIAGISIGAINGAIIAGNPPEKRVARLREFWEGISEGIATSPFAATQLRTTMNEWNAANVVAFGVPGFFAPRFPPPFLMPPGTRGADSFYSTDPLRRTLETLVDFDELNSGKIRYAAGAVEITSGNFSYFDTKDRKICIDHIMASAALPPGFPCVTIDGKSYWDGGVVSNSPLQYVLDSGRTDMCLFQVDLFSAHGRQPEGVPDVVQREKEIRYSSRTRLNTDFAMKIQTLRRAVKRLLDKLPEELRDDPDAKLLRENACTAAITVVHLIHRRTAYERYSMDYEFSRLSMLEHWAAGVEDVRHTLNQPEWLNRKKPEGVLVLDLTREQEQELAP